MPDKEDATGDGGYEKKGIDEIPIPSPGSAPPDPGSGGLIPREKPPEGKGAE